MVLLHCVEDHSSRIDAHGKGGVSTSIVTKMSYCVFTKTETKGAKEDNGAIVRLRARVCFRLQAMRECQCNDTFMKVCVCVCVGRIKQVEGKWSVTI